MWCGELTDDTSVVDQDVDGTEGLDGRVDDLFAICDRSWRDSCLPSS